MFRRMKTTHLSFLNQWMADAEKNEINDPNAVALATVNRSNQPDVRMVLLKDLAKMVSFFY